MLSSSSCNGVSHFSPCLNWNPSSTATSSSPSFCLRDNNLALLHHRHEDLLSCGFTVSPIIDQQTTTAAAATLANNSTKTASSSTTNYNTQMSAFSKPCCPPPRMIKKVTASKRDRHSKIYTAQGLRDRRVRLSIEISRKFFGLQDLLGFDKASLTLDWLLTKSRTAIRELLQTKQIDDSQDALCRRLCSLSEDGDFLKGTTQEEEEEEEEAAAPDNTKNTAAACSKVRKRRTGKQKRGGGAAKKPKIMTALDKLAKESRAKARERARERTREKNSLRNLINVGQEQMKLPDLITFSPPPPPQNNQAAARWAWSQMETCKSSDNSSRQSTMTSSFNNNENTSAALVEGFFFVNPWTGLVNGTSDEMFQDSSVVRIKRKTKLPCSNFGNFQRTLIAANSKGSNSDFNNWPASVDMP